MAVTIDNRYWDQYTIDRKQNQKEKRPFWRLTATASERPEQITIRIGHEKDGNTCL